MPRRIFLVSLPILLSAGFFIFIAGASPAHAAPANFTLSGGPNQTDNFCVDDDIYVYLNGNLIYSDIDPYWASCNNRPISFQANSSDSLRVVAIDSVGICRSIGPLWLHYGAKAVALDSGQ